MKRVIKFESLFRSTTISRGNPVTKRAVSTGYDIHFYDILFLKFSDFTLDKKSIEAFLSLTPDLLLMDWLEDLSHWNANVSAYFHEFENLSKSFSPLCLFGKGMGVQLLAQFFRLQAFLKENANKPIKADEILNNIIFIKDDHSIDVGLFLYQNYQKAKGLPGTPSEQLKAITGPDSTSSLNMTQSQSSMFQELPKRQNKNNFAPHKKPRRKYMSS